MKLEDCEKSVRRAQELVENVDRDWAEKTAGTDAHGIDLENRARSTHELLYQYGKDNVWQKTKDDFFS